MAPRRKKPTIIDTAPVAVRASRRKPLPKDFTQADLDVARDAASTQGFSAGYDRRASEAAFDERQRELRAAVESIETMPGPGHLLLLGSLNDGRQATIISVSLAQLRVMARGLREHWNFPTLRAGEVFEAMQSKAP